MKWKQNIISFILGMAIMLPVGGYAATKITAQYNDVKVAVDGAQVNTKVVGVVEQGQRDGRNFTSAADVAKAMGGTVAWNGTTKTVEIKTPRTDLETVVANVKDSAVMIYAYNGSKLTVIGSGFVYEGNVVTAKHVIAGANKYIIYTDNSIYGIESTKADISSTLDVAVIKADLDLPSVKLGDSDKLIEGEKLVSITSPKGFKNAVDECLYSGVDYNYGYYYLGLTESEMESGSSGGAVFNDRSEIVGMVVRGATITNTAIPINDLKEFIK
jgi:S1-C subfamily serine protease